MKKQLFFWRIWPDLGNTARADMARLGSIGLPSVNPMYIFYNECLTKTGPYNEANLQNNLVSWQPPG